jgi:hypothetical protein
LAAGGYWNEFGIVRLSDEGDISFEDDGRITLRQECTQEQECKEIEAVIDLSLNDIKPDGNLIFRTDRGHWGWTEWELMNALGPEPVGVANQEYRSVDPVGISKIVSSNLFLEPLAVHTRLGHQPEGYRLRLRASEADGLHEVIQLGGSEARQTNPMEPGAPTSYLYFEIDDAFYFNTPQLIELQIEYFDDGNEWIMLDYDTAPPEASANDPRAFTDVGIVQREDSQTWKTASVVIDDARFTNHQHGAYDFRLATGSTPLAVRYVQLTKLH